MRSNVAGADVFIDRQPKGITGRDSNLELQLDSGTHRVQLRKTGYQDSAERSIEIVARKQKPLSFTLREIEGQTFLKIESKPQGASVRIDDKAAGSTQGGRPLSAKVSPGPHIVQFNLDGYESYTANVTIKEGENLPIRAVLRPKPPTDTYLILQSQAGAEVRVDGNMSGTVGPGGTLQVKVSPGSRRDTGQSDRL